LGRLNGFLFKFGVFLWGFYFALVFCGLGGGFSLGVLGLGFVFLWCFLLLGGGVAEGQVFYF
jgi:hypothetical protein